MSEPLPALRSLWDFSDPAASEARMREALARAQQLDETDYALRLQTQIARALGLQRRFEEAHALLDRVEPQLAGASPEAAVRYRLERGRAFNSGGEPPRSLPHFEQAWQLARDAGEHNLAVDALHMLAIAAPTDEQLAWSERAIDYAESCGCERARGWLGALYNNTGWTHHELGDYERALELWRRGVAFREPQGGEPYWIALWTVGRALRSLGQLQQAVAQQLEVVALREAAGAPGGFAHEELALAYQALAQPDQARRHAARAVALLTELAWFVDDEPERLEALRQLAAG